MNDLEAVLFDFGGTLDADGVPWKERTFRLFADEGLTVARERFDPCFHGVDDALVGTLSPACSLRETVSRLVGGVAEMLRPGDPRLAERVTRRFLEDALARITENASLLRVLRGRYRLGVVSNFYGNLAGVCEETGLRACLDVLVDSAVVGFRKPDPRIFGAALAVLGVEPSRAAFVGDSVPRDMAGARGIGMRHIWLADGSDSASWPCCRDDRRIGSLGELRGILL